MMTKKYVLMLAEQYDFSDFNEFDYFYFEEVEEAEDDD